MFTMNSAAIYRQKGVTNAPNSNSVNFIDKKKHITTFFFRKLMAFLTYLDDRHTAVSIILNGNRIYFA